MKKVPPLIRKTLKAIMWVATVFTLIFVIVASLIRIPGIQNRVLHYATSFVSNRTQTRVEIRKIFISFPKSVVAEGLFLEDQQKDTLLYAGKAKINIVFRDLFSEKISINSFALENSIINLNRLTADSLFNYYFLVKAFGDTTLQKKTRTRPRSKWTISVRDMSLENTRIVYEDKNKGTDATAILGIIEIKNGTVDLHKKNASLDYLYLSESNILFTASRRQADSSMPGAVKVAESGDTWTVEVRTIMLDNNSLGFQVRNKPKTGNSFDTGHMSFDHILLEAGDFFYSSDSTRVSVSKFIAVDQNEFRIAQFETDLSINQHSITAKKLKLKTAGSSIAADLKIEYSSLGSLKDSMPLMNINLDMQKLSIRNSDIVYFIPELSGYAFFNNRTNVSTLSGNINGRINSLEGKDLVVTAGISTVIKTDFAISGLPEAKTATYTFPNLRIRSGRRDIEMIAGAAIPASIELPENINTEIAFKGKLKAFESTISMASSYGSAEIIVSVDESENFRSEADITGFNLGRLLKDTAMFGSVTLTAAASGQGLEKKSMRADISAEVSRFRLKKYTYRKFHADGMISRQKLAGRINLNDENAVFDFDGSVNLNSGRPALKFLLNISGANLQKLGFTKDDIRLSLIAAADLQSDTSSILNGRAAISNLIVARGEKIFVLDSLLVASINEPGKRELNHSGALIAVKYSGTVSPAAISSGLSAFINDYFPFSENIRMRNNTDSSDFSFEILLHNHPILSQVLLPGLKEFETGSISGSFDSQKNDLKLNAVLKRVFYGTTQIRDFLLDVSSNVKELNWAASVSSISTPQIRLGNFLFDGQITDNTIFTNITSADKENKKLEVRSQITKPDANYRIEINPKNFFLMNNRWDIDTENYILIGKNGFMVHNFFVNNTVSQINIASTHDHFDDDLNIEVRNFRLDDISRIIEKDTSLLKGNVDGNVLLKRVDNAYGIIADVTVSDLAVHDIPVGNISVRANSPAAGKFDIEINLSGQGNNLTARGFYIPGGEDNSISIETEIKSLSVKTLEAFSRGQISETTGTLNGNLLIAGTPAIPEITGELVFNNVFLKPAVLNNRLGLGHETIQISKEGLNFNSFTVTDASMNTAVIDGTVHMTRFRDFSFNLNVSSKDFLLFNTTARDNKVFYGRMIIDSRIEVKGPLELPVARGTIKMKKGSNFTFAVPEEKLSTDKGEDVVEFDDSLRLNPILSAAGEITVPGPHFTGVDLSAIIEIDRQATLRLLMDPASDDSLVIRGESALSFAMDRSGKMDLTGTYNVVEGNYIVSLKSLVKRKFDIISGSTIIWNGDPLDAEISINAKYTVRTAPYDLVAIQMSSLSETEKAGYRRQYPFLVMLKLRGKILHPVISFEIELPPEYKGILSGAVNQKLSMLNENESALNKQVFALLVLGRFVQENPLISESGGTSTLVRSTVGNILSAQLNRLSSKVIRGVGLNFDVQSYNDYQTGEAQGRTEVEIGIKKHLFDERLSVQLGGSVDVEGEKAGKNSASDITGDVEIEYKLTQDGRYRLKAFRHNQYEGAIEGQLIESGVGIVFMRDFNKWKDAFRALKRKSNKPEKKRKNGKISDK